MGVSTKEEYESQLQKDLDIAQGTLPTRTSPEQAAADKSKYGISTFSTDSKIATGQKSGLERAQTLYGIKPDEIGGEVSMTRGMRKARLEGKDPAASSLRDSRNRRLRMAKARGASSGELAQIERSAETDIGREEETRSGKRLSEYEKSITGALRGVTGLELGYGQLEKAGEVVNRPGGGGGGFLDTVICTELHRQGYMSDKILIKDREYGAELRRTNPDIYFGYRFLADPIVVVMKKSPLFTKLISIPTMAWANNMAGNTNILGMLVSFSGELLCGIVGKSINWRTRYAL